jgi:hypothetical protein
VDYTVWHNDVEKIMHLQIAAYCELLNETELHYQYQGTMLWKTIIASYAGLKQ